jgi:hypothetical protein
MLHVHAVCPCCMSMLYLHDACPCLYTACASYLSRLHVRAACSCCMSMLYVHAVCPCCISMLHVHGACSCCMSMLHVYAACPCSISAACLCCMSVLHPHTACPCCMSILHVHAACRCCMPTLHLYVHRYKTFNDEKKKIRQCTVQCGAAIFSGNQALIGVKPSSLQFLKFWQVLHWNNSVCFQASRKASRSTKCFSPESCKKKCRSWRLVSLFAKNVQNGFLYQP